MRIDFSTVLSDIAGGKLSWRSREGSLVVDDHGRPKPMTLGSVCSEALLNNYDDDRGATGDAKLKRFRLAMKVGDGGEVELKVEEITELKTFIAKAFGPLIVGRAYDLLDPESDAPAMAPKSRPTAVG